MVEGTHIFGQTRSAEGEPGSEVAWRNVQLVIGGEDFDDGLGIDLHLLAQRAHLVGESNFQRVPCIADILDHFNRAERAFEDPSGRPGIEFA